MSPGGTQTRSRIKSGKLSEQHLTVTPGGVTKVWHDRTPNDEKPEERKARKNSNKSSTQAARRCKTRASVAPDVHDAELAMRREIRASVAPEIQEADLAMRRAAYADMLPDIRAAKLRKRRENRPQIQVRLKCSNLTVSEHDIFLLS